MNALSSNLWQRAAMSVDLPLFTPRQSDQMAVAVPTDCIANENGTGFVCPDYCGPGFNWTVNYSPNSFSGGYVFECVIDGCQKGISTKYDCGQEVYHELDKACLPCIPSNLTFGFIQPTPEVASPIRVDLNPISYINTGSLPRVSFYSACPLTAASSYGCIAEFEGCTETTFCVDTALWVYNCSNVFASSCSALTCDQTCTNNYQFGSAYAARTPLENVGFHCNGYDPTYVPPFSAVSSQAGTDGFSCTHEAFPFSIQTLSDSSSSAVSTIFNWTTALTISCNRFTGPNAEVTGTSLPAGSLCTCDIPECNSCSFDESTSFLNFDCSNLFQGSCVGYQNGQCVSRLSSTSPTRPPVAAPTSTRTPTAASGGTSVAPSIASGSVPVAATARPVISATVRPTVRYGASVPVESPQNAVTPTVPTADSNQTGSTSPSSVKSNYSAFEPSGRPSIRPSTAAAGERVTGTINFPIQITNYLLVKRQDTLLQALNDLATNTTKALFGRRRRVQVIVGPRVEIKDDTFPCAFLNTNPEDTVVCYNVTVLFHLQLTANESPDQISSSFVSSMTSAISRGDLITKLKQIDPETPFASYNDPIPPTVSSESQWSLLMIGLVSAAGSLALVVIFGLYFWFCDRSTPRRQDHPQMVATQAQSLPVASPVIEDRNMPKNVATMANSAAIGKSPASTDGDTEYIVLNWLAGQGNVAAVLSTLDRMIPDGTTSETTSSSQTSPGDVVRSRVIVDFLLKQTFPTLSGHVDEFMTHFAGREDDLIEILQKLFQRSTAQKGPPPDAFKNNG